MQTENGSVETGNPTEWYAGFGDKDLSGYVQNKGFKDPESLANSYRNFEKLQGVPQDRLLKLPERTDAPEWGDIYNRLGRPEDPKGYELAIDGADEAFAGRMAEVMHKTGVPKSAAKALSEEWNNYVKDLIDTDSREAEQRDLASMTELRSKWGGKFDENAELGRRAGREFGLSEDDFASISSSLGSGKTLELFQRIGSKLGEAPSFDPSGASAGKTGFGLSPEAARERIKALTGDRDWTSRYLNGGVSEKDEMSRLQLISSGAK